MQEFMDGIADMVKNLVQTYHSISDEQKSMFGGNQSAQEALGKCPKCGGDVVKGKYGAYCKSKCGMNVGKAMGTVLSDTQIKSMLEGKKTFVKGLKGKKGTYDAYLIPEGIEDYSYTKDGKEIKGSDHVYEYDAKEHELFRSDRAGERAKQKEEKRDEKKERPSLKERLAEKKNDVMKMDAGRKQPTADKKKEAVI